MGFARAHARDLRREAEQLRGMGLNNLAKDRDEQADLFERIADEAAAEEYHGPGYRERDEFKRGDPGHPDNEMGM